MKYIIMDLDDTLLNHQKEITKYSIEGLSYLKERYGFLIVFNTARSYLSALPYIDLIKPDYTILDGGVLILDSKKNIIFKDLINKELTNEILELIKENKYVMNYSVEGENKLYTPDLPYLKVNSLANYFSFNEPFMEGAYKIMVNTMEREEWRALANSYRLFFESYFNTGWCRISKGSKRTGNLWLFNYLKDDKPMDYCFGDDRGDKEMLDKAYHGVYLLNSDPSIREPNSRLTRYDSDNDGVIRYMLALMEGINEDNIITN